MALPADICNEALDAIAAGVVIGDMSEGTKAAQLCLRHYGTSLREMLRSAHWACARKMAPMTLLADASGNTPGVSTFVQQPWLYAYALPTDCIAARFVPWNPFGNPPVPTGNVSIPTTPLTSASGQQPWTGMRLQPSKFLVGTDYNYPVDQTAAGTYSLGITLNITGATQANPGELIFALNPLANGDLIYVSGIVGMTALNGQTFQIANCTNTTLTLQDLFGNAIDTTSFPSYVSGGTVQQVLPALPASSAWGQGVQWWNVQGVSPVARTVVYSNVQQAQLVYTAFLPYPNLWDNLLRQAIVAYLATKLAMPIWADKDRKFGMAVRNAQVAIAKDKLSVARARDGNEGSPSANVATDWMRARHQGGGYWVGSGVGNNQCDGIGVFGYGWDNGCSLDSNVY